MSSDLLLIDSHIHIYPRREIGEGLKANYVIADYGSKDGVEFSRFSGVVEDALKAIRESGVRAAAVLNIFEMDGWPEPPAGRWWPTDPPHGDRREDLIASNEWVTALGREHPQLLPFVSVHPAVMAAPELLTHFEEMLDRHGARGLKLHPTSQRIDPGEPAMQPIFAACAVRGVPVIAHSGIDKRGAGLADLHSFAPVLESQPGLKLVLAHLGGGLWQHAEEFAARFPAARFDLCEIIEWTDSERGPGRTELARLIRAIGAERILMGSDFPWYDLDHTVDLVLDLPLLSDEEKAAIVGTNAAALLELGDA